MRHEVQVELIERLLGGERSPEPVQETRVPVELYRSEEQLTRERNRLFRELATPIAHISEVPAPGDFITREVAGVPVLVVREKTGALRGFVNVCRHRGAPLADARTGTGCKALVCPYHGWVYQLDGTLSHVPGEAFFPNLDKSQLGLVALPLVAAYGLVWVIPEGRGSVTARPAPENGAAERALRAAFGPFGDDLDHFGLAEHHLFRKTEAVRRCNWKLIIDAFLEGYHVKTLHRRSLARFFDNSGPWFEFFGDHVRSVGARKNIADMAQRPRAEWDIRACATPFYLFFPNTVVVIHPDFVSVLTVMPLRTDETAYSHYLLTPENPDPDGPQKELYARYQRSFELIDGAVFAAEDLDIAERIQRGLSSEAYEHFILGGAEYPIRVFHDTIARHLER